MYRLAFYSHDTYGLGHYRRSLKIADAIAAQIGPLRGLFLTGSSWSHLFTPPRGFRVVKLPPVVKVDRGVYASREPGKPLATTLRQRVRRIGRTLAAFGPDLLIVDNVPCGLHGEVLPALRALKKGGGVRLILALRDILDRSDAITAEWQRAGAEEALVELYDEIWVFGDDEDVRTLVLSGPLAPAGEKVYACGRLGHRAGPEAGPQPRRPQTRNGKPAILVTGGGGGDASPLIRTYLEALRLYRPDVVSRVVLGPDFPTAEIAELESRIDRSTNLYRFLPELPTAMAGANLVVAMAGYNTVCEIRATGRPAVLVPRVEPRQEQLLRALKMQRAGRARVIHPDVLTPSSLWTAATGMLSHPAPSSESQPGGWVAAHRAAVLLGAQP